MRTLISRLLHELGKSLMAAAIFFLIAPSALAQHQQAVDLELVLAVDTSASIDSREFTLQMVGLANAFRDPDVVSAIQAAGDHGIAVTLVQWGVGLQQRVTIPWTQIDDAASAAVFAAAIEASPRHFIANGTGISRALWFTSRLFDDNAFRGRRRAIDISGDGRNNSGVHPTQIRDRVIAEGIVVNGLAILDGDRTLGTYFEQNVAGGRDAFVLIANRFEDYATAIRLKLLREILVPVAGKTTRRPSLT